LSQKAYVEFGTLDAFINSTQKNRIAYQPFVGRNRFDSSPVVYERPSLVLLLYHRSRRCDHNE